MFDVEVTISDEQDADYVLVQLHDGERLYISVSPDCPADALAFLAPEIAAMILDALVTYHRGQRARATEGEHTPTDPTGHDLFGEIRSLDEMRAFIATGYSKAMPPKRVFGGTGASEKSPLAVAEPGPLMAHAVALAGPDGLTLQQLHDVFWLLGKERFDRGVATMRSGGQVTETKESRPNRVGRPQMQVVFRRQ
jgi:hypothetical protein